MKTCPKCGENNNPDRITCTKCSASLPGGTGDSEGQAAQGPAEQSAYRPTVAGPSMVSDKVIYSGGPLGGGGGDDYEGPVSVVGQPLGQGLSGGQPPSPYGEDKPSAFGPPKLRYKDRGETGPKPLRYSRILPIVGAVVPLIIVVAIGIFLYWRFMVLPKGPLTATRIFIEALNSNDWEGLKNSVDSDSKAILEGLPTYIARFGAQGITNLRFDIFNSQSQGFTEGKEFELGVLSLEPTQAKINVAPGPTPIDDFKAENLAAAYKDGYPIYVVKEGEVWKVDLAKTVQPFLPWYGPLAENIRVKMGIPIPKPPNYSR